MLGTQPVLDPPFGTALAERTTLVVPTYNEVEGITAFLQETERHAPGLRVLISDDDSPDGTRDMAEDFGGDLAIQVLHRRDPADRGLTASVADAILEAKTEFLVVMDADLQHPPETIRRLVRALEGGADAAIAARSDDTSFSRRRRFLSRAARALARRHLRRRTGLDITDPMSGFFAVRTDVAQAIVRRHGEAFQRSGFKVLMDLLLYAPRGLAVVEVPYVFNARRAGESKLTARHYLSFLRQLGGGARLLASFLDLLATGVLPRFLAVGLTGVFVNLFTLFGLHEAAGLPVAAAAPIAIEMSVLWNFAWNESWTFRGRGGSDVASRLGKFHLASLAGMVLQWLVVALGTLSIPNVPYLALAVAGIVAGSVTNFLLNLKWTWGVPIEEPERAR